MNDQVTLLPLIRQTRNAAIREAYFKTIQEIAELSKSFPNFNLRARIEIDREHYPGERHEIFELLTPYAYLLLTTNDEGQLRISYAINDNSVGFLGQIFFTQVIRIIYLQTLNSLTNIQDCLEIFPYHSEIYEEARHMIRDHEYEDYHYKLIIEEFKG